MKKDHDLKGARKKKGIEGDSDRDKGGREADLSLSLSLLRGDETFEEKYTYSQGYLY